MAKMPSSPSHQSLMIGRGAGAGFEQPHARRIARLLHRGAGDVQREPLRGVEGGMLARRQMNLALDIFRPLDVFGIHRADHGEPAFGPPPRRLEHQRFEHWLPIVAVSPEIAEVPAARPRGGSIQLGIDRAVQNARHRSAVAALDEAQSRVRR